VVPPLSNTPTTSGCGVSARDQILRADVAEFVGDVRKQRQVLEALDVRARIEVQRLRSLQPERRARRRVEMPVHRCPDELIRIGRDIEPGIQRRLLVLQHDDSL
jgi:hypothetical protein